MPLRLIYSLICLFLMCAGMPASAQNSVAENANKNTASCGTLSTPKVYNARHEAVLEKASIDELSALARRLYQIRKVRAKQERLPPPAELTKDILTDRNKLIEYIRYFDDTL